MRFGIYAEMQTAPGKSHADMTWEILRQIEHADQVGFDVYSVIDHHFFQKFSISANPLALFSAAAQLTERIRFRVALFTLPLENPMRLAGQIAEADILTRGRLECGLGRGHAWLFGPSNVPLEESRPRYDEAIEILEARRDVTVVFTDIQMPGSMDGLKLARAVRGRWPPIKIVATSALDVTETELPEGGRFLPKPYSPFQVTGVLRELTGA